MADKEAVNYGDRNVEKRQSSLEEVIAFLTLQRKSKIIIINNVGAEEAAKWVAQ